MPKETDRGSSKSESEVDKVKESSHEHFRTKERLILNNKAINYPFYPGL